MPLSLDGKTYIIAEIGANHNGDMTLARELVRAAHAAGADAAKFQSWNTGLFARPFYESHPGLEAQVGDYAISPADLGDMARLCRETGIDFSSTPFTNEEVRQLDALEPAFVKIASMDLTNDRLLKAAAATGRTIVLSTGMGSMGEIEHALETLEAAGHDDTVLLHCIALYPPPGDDYVNLRNMETLRAAFGYPVGYSDHTLGIEVTLAAIALGAVVIEKHFTLDKSMDGWDHAVSADPADMAVITSAARRIPAALGSARRTVSPAEAAQGKVMRRSAVAARAIARGTVIADADIEFRRPGTGIAPNDAARLVGQVAMRDIAADDLLSDDMFAPVPERAPVVSDAA